MKIKCPACAHILEVPDSAAGKVVGCPCGKRLRVPGPATVAAPQEPSSPPGVDPGNDFGDNQVSGFDQLTDDDLVSDRQPTNPYALPTDRSSSVSGAAGPPPYDRLRGYASPGSTGYGDGRPHAGLGQRIGGALIDSAAMFGMGMALAVVGAGIGFLIDAQDDEMLIVLGYVGFYIGIFAMAIVNAVLISISGQSVGKKIAGTRIVDRDSGNQVGFLQGVLLRNFVFSLITGIPCLGPIIAIADLIMLFPLPHETLHDKLARTIVVQA